MRKTDTATVTVNVVCPFCKPLEFQVPLEVVPAKAGEQRRVAVQSSVEVHCSYCHKSVRVTIDEELKPDVSVLRGS